MPSSWIVIGLGFGDEGKGTIVDSLVRKTGASTVVRFNGGAQAAHNVVTPDGRHHTFSQWGAGTLAGARTILTKDMLIHPLAMVEEAKALKRLGVSDPFELMMVDGRALVTTPYHGAINQLREAVRGSAVHGSCGVGVGETVADSLEDDHGMCLRAEDLAGDPVAMAIKVRSLRHRKVAEGLRITMGDIPRSAHSAWRMLNDREVEIDVITALRAAGRVLKACRWDELAEIIHRGNVVCEGAQGVLLDEWYGFHPHTTWSTTTSSNARAALVSADVPAGSIQTIGVLRTYATRHGAGPFPAERKDLPPDPGEHNAQHPWQGKFRVGDFDAVLARYALEVDGTVDSLAITWADILPDPPCIAYRATDGNVLRLKVNRNRDLPRQEQLGTFLANVSPVRAAHRWSPADISTALNVPIAVTSHGPRSDQKKWRDIP